MRFSTLISSTLFVASSSVLANPAPQMLAGASAQPVLPAISESVGGAAAVAAAATPAANNSTGVATGTTTAAAAGSTSSGVIGGTSGSTAVWVIKVGSSNDDLVFSPNSLTAKPGDMVQFQFYAKNHSVASTTFNAPCVPEKQTNPAATNAFWSGFMPTDQQGEFVFTMMVADTNPVYYYCAQGMHCQSGMVGVINPPATGNTLQAFTQKAAQAPMNISPSGQGTTTSSGGSSGGTIGSGTSAAPVASTTKSAATMNVRIAWWSLALSTVVAVLLS